MGFRGRQNLPGEPNPRGILPSHLFSLPSSQVEDVYCLVHQTMSQPHVKDYVPFSWTTMVHVKSEHFKALSHYFAAIALCDCPGECPAWRELPAHPSTNSTSFLGFGEGFQKKKKKEAMDTTPEVFEILRRGGKSCWRDVTCGKKGKHLPALGHLVLGQPRASKIKNKSKSTLDLTSSLMDGCPGNFRVVAARHTWSHGVTWSVTSRCDP